MVCDEHVIETGETLWGS